MFLFYQSLRTERGNRKTRIPFPRVQRQL
ncbi:hypothetical protein V1477_000683 [Vespula maculifrons]|uniref:Uncharacterized protein n=1 Tax=Vespula maculifrons TaxID=7453 RepID=A0ABD2D3I5_VESMC